MNKILLLALAGSLLFGAAIYLSTNEAHSNNSNSDDTLAQQWKQFKITYNKKFSDPEQDQYRMEVFADNLQVIQRDQTGTFGITPFSDLTQAEFAQTYLTLNAPAPSQNTDGCADDVDVNVNWVQQGKVSAVKNQGQCGSCWAFSSTGAMESALYLSGASTNVVLSEQQLVDCSSSFGNEGCNGGWMDQAFDYVQQNGITTEQNYPYTGVEGTCQNPKSELSWVSSHTDVPSGCVSDLKQAVNQQPVSVAVDATYWSYYTQGVFSFCGDSLNHGVLLVGFQNGAWLVKNSWGTSWGQSGYIQLADGNTCGIAKAASYPSV